MGATLCWVSTCKGGLSMSCSTSVACFRGWVWWFSGSWIAWMLPSPTRSRSGSRSQLLSHPPVCVHSCRGGSLRAKDFHCLVASGVGVGEGEGGEV